MGISQARILEWVAMPFSMDRTWVSCIADGFFTLSYRKLETKYCVMAYMGKESKTSGYMYLCNRFTLLYT